MGRVRDIVCLSSTETQGNAGSCGVLTNVVIDVAFASRDICISVNSGDTLDSDPAEVGLSGSRIRIEHGGVLRVQQGMGVHNRIELRGWIQVRKCQGAVHRTCETGELQLTRSNARCSPFPDMPGQ